jgi:hypothetical protein
MKQYKVTQHNADKLRLGEDYFDRHIVNSDIALLQRVPESKIAFLKERFPKVYHTNHSRERSNGKTLNLVIAGPEELGEWSHRVHRLPSYSKVMSSDEENQGCKVLHAKLNDTLLSSVITCYPYDDITSIDAYEDVKAVFKICKSQSTKCLLVGDLHRDAVIGPYKKLSQQYGFIKNYIESEITFKSQKNQFMNMDWCLSNNQSIAIDDISVHKIDSKEHGHFAITYKLKI